VKTSVPFETVSGTTYYSISKSYYDPAGNVISTNKTNNRAGQTTTWARTDYAYDLAGSLIQTTLFDTAGTAKEYTQYYYDDAGNLLRQYTGLHAPLTINGLDDITTNGDTDYAVVKNTLLRFAANNTGLGGLDPFLNGTTALAISTTDPVAPAKILSEYAKKNDSTIKIKAGFVEGKTISATEVNDLAELPSREVLVAQVLGTLLAPITGLANVCNTNIRGLAVALAAIAEKKSA
jgi:large subunit ribosomal protein L10